MTHQNTAYDPSCARLCPTVSVSEKRRASKWLAFILSESNYTLSESIHQTQAGSICTCFPDKLEATPIRSHTSTWVKSKPRSMNPGNSWPFTNFLRQWAHSLLKNSIEVSSFFLILNISYFSELCYCHKDEQSAITEVPVLELTSPVINILVTKIYSGGWFLFTRLYEFPALPCGQTVWILGFLTEAGDHMLLNGNCLGRPTCCFCKTSILGYHTQIGTRPLPASLMTQNGLQQSPTASPSRPPATFNWTLAASHCLPITISWANRSGANVLSKQGEIKCWNRSPHFPAA